MDTFSVHRLLMLYYHMMPAFTALISSCHWLVDKIDRYLICRMQHTEAAPAYRQQMAQARLSFFLREQSELEISFRVLWPMSLCCLVRS